MPKGPLQSRVVTGLQASIAGVTHMRACVWRVHSSNEQDGPQKDAKLAHVWVSHTLAMDGQHPAAGWDGRSTINTGLRTCRMLSIHFPLALPYLPPVHIKLTTGSLQNECCLPGPGNVRCHFSGHGATLADLPKSFWAEQRELRRRSGWSATSRHAQTRNQNDVCCRKMQPARPKHLEGCCLFDYLCCVGGFVC